MLLPGEWHFMVHLLLAFHILYWQCMLAHIVVALGWEKTVKGKWSVEKFEHHERFHELLIVCLVQYMIEVVPIQYLYEPRDLLQSVEGNVTSSLAIHYLFDCGLPWLRLRHAMRANEHATIDLMWIYSLQFFRATNKFWYAIIAVVVTAIRFALAPPFALIWTLKLTASLSRAAGRRVAWDLVNEKLNRAFSQTAGALLAQTARERLKQIAGVINAFNWITPRFRRATGQNDKEEGSEYNHVTAESNAADRAVMMDYLRRILGPDFAALCRPSKVNKFDPERHRYQPPWDRVYRAAMGEWADGNDEGEWGDEGGEEAEEEAEEEDENGALRDATRTPWMQPWPCCSQVSKSPLR